ncbi:MAG: uncharacterized protein H6R29_93 [Methanomicrobia archaeon]|nr:uncharacterized protein [Methanomicrobia archaeon]MDD1647617.1 hypothetical protein [Methanomicrobiales archaeon]
MIRWLNHNFSSLRPDRAAALAALRHLSKGQKKNLFSMDPGTMKTAEGRWYEALIYEMVLRLAVSSDSIHHIVSKGADARIRRLKVQLGQNGLFYSQSGDIKVRGNGQDLAEFDLLLLGRDHEIAFGEIVTSSANLNELEEEIAYKKKLLGYLFGQEKVPFMLFSSVDISRVSAVRRLLRDPTNTLLSTATCEEIKTLIRPDDLSLRINRPPLSPKLVEAPELALARPFDYKSLHDTQRSRILSGLWDPKRGLPKGSPSDGTDLVKKILLGALFPPAVRVMGQEVRLRVGDRVIPPGELLHRFSKVIPAVNLPDGEPLIYLKSREKRHYLKMVKSGDRTFRFESNRSYRMMGFYLWLQSIQPSLGSRVAHQVLTRYFR